MKDSLYRGARILIVDDDRLVLAGLAGGLEDRGYLVLKAATGEEAVSLADSAQPDLVLMDICLPGISGVEAARRIQENSNVPVIFLSAYESEEVVRVALALGDVGYFAKPVAMARLAPAVENALARSRDLNRLRESEEYLGTALTQSREIGVAIGMLMERRNASAEACFAMLRDRARSTRLSTGAAAREVISGALPLDAPARVNGKLE